MNSRPLRTLWLVLGLLAPYSAAAQQTGAYVAYAWANMSTSPSYTPDPTYSFNPLGDVTVTRSAAGRYTVRFGGFGALSTDEAGQGGHVQVSAYNTPGYTCKPTSWSGGTVQVRCQNAAGTPADAVFTVMLLYPGADPGRLGFAWANEPTAATYFPSGRYAYNPAGTDRIDNQTTDAHVVRSGVGQYRLYFEEMQQWERGGLGGWGHGQVTAYGNDAATCKLRGLGFTDTDYSYTVDCYDAAGARADAQFNALALWPEADAGTLAFVRTSTSTGTSITTPAVGAYNPDGAIDVTRTATGAYTVRFGGLAAQVSGSAGGHVQVTAEGSNAAQCQVGGWGPTGVDLSIAVRCYDASGNAADSKFLAAFFLGAAPEDDAEPATADFEGYAAGTTLSNQLLGDGIRFPLGLEVIDCTARDAACTHARSSDQVAAPEVSFEFARHPVVIEFPTPQRVVEISVNGYGQDGREYSIGLRAFNESGAQVREHYETFQSGPAWTTRLRVESPHQEIVRVELLSTRTGAGVDNWILVDDLFISDAVPPPDDTEDPNVIFWAPTRGVTVTSEPVEIRASGIDDQLLDRFAMRVTRLADGAEVWPPSGITPDLCGGEADPCPAKRYDGTIVARLDQEGKYLATATAEDAAGNVATDTLSFTYQRPPPPPDVAVRKIEFNQAVADRLYDNTLLEEPTLVRGKNLLVRYYLFADGGTRRNYAAGLILTVEKRDGSRREYRVSPNTGIPQINVEADPGAEARPDTLLQQRATIWRTLNFVVPGDWLRDAAWAQFRLWDSGALSNLSVIQTERFREAYLVVRPWLVVHPSLNGGSAPVSAGELDTLIVDFVRHALPVTDVFVLPNRTFRWEGISWWEDTVLDYDECSSVLSDLADVTGSAVPESLLEDLAREAVARAGHDLPDEAPFWVVNLGLVRAIDGCGGIAYRKSAGSAYYRYAASTAVTEPSGRVATHEMMHTIGFKHASNGHGEGDGGSWESWPYPHGLLSSGIDGFGATMVPTTPPSDAGAGTWGVTIVDPCPTSDLSVRRPCTLPEGEAPHEIMSYGNGTSFVPLATPSNRWVSDRNYSRFYSAIRLGITPSAARAGEGPVVAQSADSAARGVDPAAAHVFRVEGVIWPDDTAGLAPFLETEVPAVALAEQATGSLALDLYDGDGALLSSTSFEPTEIAEAPQDRIYVRAFVPHVEGVQRAVLKREGNVVLDQTASANTPTVRVLTPNGGEDLAAGTATIRWEAADADGDRLAFLVQYSPDDGATWQGIARSTSDDALEATLDIEELIPGREGLVRVVASDGLNTAVDASDAFFTLGTPTTGMNGIDPALPEAYALDGVAPNPFQGRAVVRYELPSGARVRLDVFDLLGRRVATLVDGEVPAGRHEAYLNVEGSPSGVYIVRLLVDGRSFTKRAMLLR